MFLFREMRCWEALIAKGYANVLNLAGNCSGGRQDKSGALIWAVVDKTDLGCWIRFSGLDLMVEIDLCTLSLGGFSETKVRSFISSGDLFRKFL